MKCCEDFKNHCWKFLKHSIRMYSIILWWNAMLWGFQKSSLKDFEKIQFLCVLLFCDEMMEDFNNHCWQFSILIFFLCLWWKAVRISKSIVEKNWKSSSIIFLLFCDEMLWGFLKSLLKIFNSYVFSKFVMKGWWRGFQKSLLEKLKKFKYYVFYCD